MIETNNGKTLYNALNRIKELEAENKAMAQQIFENVIEHEKLVHENTRLLAANRDLNLHWDVLKDDYDSLKAQVKAADGMRDAITSITKMETTHGEWDDGCFYFNGKSSPEMQEPLVRCREAIAAYDNAKEG